MPRTPLARLIRQLYRNAHAAKLTGLPVEARQEKRSERTLSRRSFLGTGVMAGAAGVIGLGATAVAGNGRRAPAIAIVGAGLAGLTCAYRLRQAGYHTTVYEAASRLGGRCYTRRGYFAEGQIAEHGGELIDTDHTDVQDLAAELGLQLDDLIAAEPAGSVPVYRFDGKKYTFAQATADFQGIYDQLQNDLNNAGYPTLWNSSTPAGQALDHISLAQYIDNLVPGGHKSPFGQLLDVAYNIEFGAETSDQSALNLLYLLGYSVQQEFQSFGTSDEHYHIRGGNDQMVSLMASSLANQIETGCELVSIRRQPDGRYSLVFDGTGAQCVVADHVVLALPFSILRSSVDYSQAGFDRLKTTAITQLGMGSNCKFHLQFNKRVWYDIGNNGETYADTGYQNTWEVSRGQAGQAGILVDFTGGNIAKAFNQGTIAQRAELALDQIEPVVPGLTKEYNGLAALDYWPGYRWTRGSYSYWKVGQYTLFSGYEGARQGNVHFCGEHTSVDSQGYLNGAVSTGNAAAAEVAADLA